LTKEAPEGTRLIVVPSRLVDRLRAVVVRRGISVSDYAVEALEQALRAEGHGASLQEAVDLYRLVEIQRGAGAVQLPRSSLDRLVGELYPENGEELRRIWSESGLWYGEYLRAKLRGEDVLGFLEKALLVSWNLDEVEIKDDGSDVALRFASFVMSLESTELLVSYVSGVMNSLGYEEVERDYLRGVATVRYMRRREQRQPHKI